MSPIGGANSAGMIMEPVSVGTVLGAIMGFAASQTASRRASSAAIHIGIAFLACSAMLWLPNPGATLGAGLTMGAVVLFVMLDRRNTAARGVASLARSKINRDR
jgi:galactitol-specific phosphotransferase system IIC component